MRRAVALSALFVLLLAGGALAQTVSQTTGAIDGKVTDTSDGAPGRDGHRSTTRTRRSTPRGATRTARRTWTRSISGSIRRPVFKKPSGR